MSAESIDQIQMQAPVGFVVKNSVLHYSYLLSDRIGKGYSSSVYKGIDERSGQLCAVKVVDLSKINDDVLRSMLVQEIASLQQLKGCDHILQLEQAVSTQRHTYIISEICPDGDLNEVIASGCLFEQEAAQLMQQIIKGYLSIHCNGIIHRDLKPMNIFLKGKELRIADFGFAARAESVREPCTYNVGSPLYMAPEVLLRNHYSFKSDIWALGIIYYEMLFGRPPWNALTEKQLAKSIQRDSILLLLPQNISRTSVKFLEWTLNPRIEARMSPEQLRTFNFDMDPLHRYARFKRRMDRDIGQFAGELDREKAVFRARQLSIRPTLPPHIPTCYLPVSRESPAMSMVNAPSEKPYRVRQPSPKRITQSPPKTVPLKISIPSIRNFHFATSVLSNELHLCRFISRLLEMLLESPNVSLRDELLNFMHHRLKVLLSNEHLNPYSIDKLSQYRSTATFEQLISTAKKYQLKWVAKFGRARDGWLLQYNNLLQLLKSEALKKYYRVGQWEEYIEAPSEVTLLDSLVSCYQLVQLCSKASEVELARQVNVSLLIARKTGGQLVYLEIEEKMKALGWLEQKPLSRPV